MATRSELNQFSCDEMCDLLKRKGEVEDDTISVFRENRVTGKAFLELTDEDLKELVTRIGERKAVKRLLEGYRPQKVMAAGLGQSTSCGAASGWLAHYRTPAKFSNATTERLESGIVTSAVRQEIVATIALQIFQHTSYPSSEEYTTVCRKLVETYPVLKETIGNGYGGWKEQIRRKFKNMRRPFSKRSAPEISSTDDKENQGEPSAKKTRTCDDDHTGESDDINGQLDEDEVQKLNTELSKDKPSRKAVKKIMKKTFKMRREWICHHVPRVGEVLEKFPPLKQSKYLVRELAAITKDKYGMFDEREAKAKWCDIGRKARELGKLESSRPKLKEILNLQEADANTYEDSDQIEIHAAHAFEVLTFLLASRSKFQLYVKFDPGCSLESSVDKIACSAPYIGFVPSDSSFNFVVIVEK